MNQIEVEVNQNIGPMSLEEYQLNCIRETIAYAKENAPFYCDLLANAPELNTLADLQKLPFTTHNDLRNSPYKLLCVSLTGVARIFSHFTTGTLGEPKKIFFSESDVDRIVRSMAAIIANVIKGTGMEIPDTKIGIYLPNQGLPLSMAEMIARGARKIGADSYIGGCKDTTENQINEIIANRPQVIMGSAFRIWRITQVGRETHDLRKQGVQALFITSEYLSSTMRARLEKAWGATVYHHYGMTEPGFAIAIECESHNGFHYNESDLYFEVIDPETGEPVADGEEGELVFTSLHREAMPLIRYRTGDIASITRKPCPCGSELSRIGTMPKKIGLIYQLDTDEDIYSSLFDEALYELDDLVDYRLWLCRKNGLDHLHCRAEIIGADQFFSNRMIDQLKQIPAIANAIDSGQMNIPTVEITPRESLRRGGKGMKRKIVDIRDENEAEEIG
ncbi:DVU_1553 family AMP-dependent CoA ligase [Acetobacterium wieringae]|uniref:DVU_1553 family AMP-dependent CoA ligase n=1 Tax=Acetobacterium wieringae TaxID=52694 RepID=UPI002B1F59CD|nr:AMP-binding protein [Acetobacterium wieringae]MEA4807276.1 AMP-binding protein [Acetobacterium wieringae]